jgi:hypothetical protein
VGLVAAQTPSTYDIAGRASVIDADTVKIHGQRIRLFGVDAPEKRRVNRSYFSAWASQYAVPDAARNAAFKAEIGRARSQIAVELATTPADDWCDTYLDKIEDVAAPFNTPVFWNDPLGQFNGPPSPDAFELWSFFNE